MRDQQINTFYNGMQKDLANTVPQEGMYTHGVNIRIVAGENGGASSGIVTNIKGLKKRLDLKITISQYVYQPTADGSYSVVNTELGDALCEIKGYTTIRNTLILFSSVPPQTFETGIGPIESNATSCIHAIDLDTFTSATLLYENSDLKFENSDYISAVGRYESKNLQKIYWTDGIQPVKTLNIKSRDIETIPSDDLILNPPINFGAPKITEVTNNGSLPAGMYQYCYRLKGSDGRRTRFSPLSNFVHIVRGKDYWEYEPDPEAQTEYSNTTPGEETDKSVTIKISNVDTTYDTIEIAAVYKTNPETPESVTIVEILNVGSENIRARHTDNEGTPLLLEEITAITSAPSRAKVLAAKDNRLFLAGVTYDTSNLEFNARAYRFTRNDGELYPRTSVNPNETSTYVDFGFDIFTEEGADQYTIQENLDAVNPFNTQGKENLGEHSYKFHPNGLTLGGKGPNIQYTFFKKRLDGNNLREMPESSPFVSSNIKTHTGVQEPYSPEYYEEGDYKSPANALEFVGYRRDEVYRFGVVLYDLQGNPGFVNWVGDIRFPDHHDYDHDQWAPTNNYTLAQQYKPDGTSNHTMGVNYHYDAGTVDAYEYSNLDYDTDSYSSISRYDRYSANTPSSTDSHLFALGLMFQVNIPEELKDKISGYRVVRLERDLSNRTVLGSGLVNYLHSFEDPDRDYQTFAAFGSHAATTLHSLSDTKDYPIGYTPPLDGNVAFRGVIKPDVFSIDAPDWPFEGYPSFDSNTYLKVDGAVRGVRTFNFTEDSSGDNFDGSATVFCQHALPPVKDNLAAIHEIAYLGKLEQAETGKQIEGIDGELGVFNRTSFIHDNDYRVWGGVGEETLLCKIESDLDWEKYLSDHDARGGTGKVMVTIKRSLGDSQYGGNTKLDRSSNSYIPAGSFISMENSVYIDTEYNRHEVWGGDTYVVMYDIEKMRKFNENLSSDTGQPARDSEKFNKESVSFAFPVESSVNTTLRSGWHFANKEDWDDDTETPLNTFELDNVYSGINNTEIFISKPNNFEGISEYDTRIVYSDVKENNTPQDAWVSYRVENYKDLDGNRGALTSLLNFKDSLYFFQQSGFGALSINPISTVIDQSGSSIVLGTGDVIQDFQYVSNKVGVNSPKSITSSETSIYFADVNFKKIYSLSPEGVQSITDTYGMKSWAYGHIGKDYTPVLGYDLKHNEIYIQYGPDIGTLIFSEDIKKFTSFYTLLSEMLFIQTPNSTYISSHNENNVGKISSLNGGVYKLADIQFTVNKNPFNVKTFDSIEWYSDKGSAEHLKSLLYETGQQTASTDSPQEDDPEGVELEGRHYIKVKENIAKISIPRESGTKNRLRDNYMGVSIQFDATKKLILHYVKTLFRISKR